ncbi:hypothetical protein BH24ACT7_BH24ACT7_13560 [soil metagenome]
MLIRCASATDTLLSVRVPARLAAMMPRPAPIGTTGRATPE